MCSESGVTYVSGMDRVEVERATGFEPATSTLGRWHSTAELRPPVYAFAPLLVQSPRVAFKNKIPIPAIIVAVALAAVGGLYLFFTPDDEDLIKQAVDQYVASVGPVSHLEIHGNVADLILAERGRLIYAEFEKRNGTWTYARNLAEEFSKAIRSPEIVKAMYQHLGERVSQRLQMSVSFKEGLPIDYRLGRDAEGLLIGKGDINFVYPKVNDQQRSGLYTEAFEWKEGRWQSRGAGSLFDAVAPPK